ncbi:MAG: bifunctional 4-hydroxy-2-oxoglutarate aldolase/2-dehydro-3-deoxy-phosphogluconate aldolase [Acidobacteria bacterium]|nr:bifunctional 4-hydroxy-2-oxoglutarate aldolase/2-dehydro-3-deoxy-phosphogluconate aldolase [Acidobacteriota bacterium]MBV9625571.1 bifunctional 4-hydroxy-2-oxoglutarate aldolase/2-dehydro-3-deoxy-phosphogluconate aldolase [Acidobacteriota bacterium]
MTKKETAEKIRRVGIIPVVRATSAEQARFAAEAVCAGGIPIVEVTMTVPGAIELIAKLAKDAAAEVLIGAGTVLDTRTAERCLDAGAEFVVSPGFDRETVELVRSHNKLMIAGALTPTEVMAAWRAGSDFVKIFPCASMGGAKYIKALKAPLPQVPMIPTGGVNLETAADLIRAGSDALGIGGELISAPALVSGNARQITEAARQYAAIVERTREEALTRS